MSKAAQRVIFGLLYGGVFLAPVISLVGYLGGFHFSAWFVTIYKHVDLYSPGDRIYTLDVGLNLYRYSLGSAVLLLGWVGVFLRSEVCLSRVALFTLVVVSLALLFGLPLLWKGGYGVFETLSLFGP